MKRRPRGLIVIAVLVIAVMLAYRGISGGVSRGSGDADAVSPIAALLGQAGSAATADPLAAARELAHETDPGRYFGFSGLTDTQRVVYAALLLGFQDFSDSIDVPSCEVADVQAALTAVVSDHPEIFWEMGDGVIETEGPDERSLLATSFTPAYTMDREMARSYSERIEGIADAFLSTIGPAEDDYHKALAIHDHIVAQTTYDPEAPDGQSIVGVFLGGAAVCAGYSRAFEYLMQREGLFCAYLTGDASDSVVTGNHAWNMIRVNGSYTYVDCTFDDPVVVDGKTGEVLPDDETARHHEYFCVGDEVFFVDHSLSDPDVLPVCVTLG